MTDEEKLKLQAFIDGELPSHEEPEVSDWIKSNPEAQELCEELNTVKILLNAGEKPLQIENTREFYWDQINRIIEPVSGETHLHKAEIVSPWMTWCRQWLVPVGGLATIVMLIVTAEIQPRPLPEIPNNLRDTESPNTQPVAFPRLKTLVEPSFAEPNGKKEGEIQSEDVNVLIQRIPTDGNPNLNPSINERTIPSIENPDR